MRITNGSDDIAMRCDGHRMRVAAPGRLTFQRGVYLWATSKDVVYDGISPTLDNYTEAEHGPSSEQWKDKTWPTVSLLPEKTEFERRTATFECIEVGIVDAGNLQVRTQSDPSTNKTKTPRSRNKELEDAKRYRSNALLPPCESTPRPST